MEATSTALATKEQLTEIANIDPASAWLYEGGARRISINNKTRAGFVIKSGGEVTEDLAELVCQITTATPVYSHQQPSEKERGKARHEDDVEWCESRNEKQTSTRNFACANCAAYAECKWKIEVELMLAERGEPFVLTLPTVSAIRFKQVVQKLGKAYRQHFSQVVWKLTVTTEESGNNVFPVVVYQAHDSETGEPYALNGDSKPEQPRAKPITAGTNGGNAKPPFKNAPVPEPVASVPDLTPPAKRDFKVLSKTWTDFTKRVAAEMPYYLKNGAADPYHIIGALKKMQYYEYTDDNADELFAMLTAYEEDAQQPVAA